MIMMTSSNGIIFHVAGRLCEEFTDRRLNKRLSKQSWGWWFETPSRPLWHHCNETMDWPVKSISTLYGNLHSWFYMQLVRLIICIYKMFPMCDWLCKRVPWGIGDELDFMLSGLLCHHISIRLPPIYTCICIYIIVTKNIRYLLWNRGVWRFFHDMYLTIEVQRIRCTYHSHDSCPLTDVNAHFTALGCQYYFKIDSWWPIVTSSTHGPAATYCSGYLWTHDVEVGASWRDCDNLWSSELFGTWLHHFAYARVTLSTAGHLHTAVPHCSHSRAPIVHTAVPRENNEHGCVYLCCRAVCKLPGCVEGHPWYGGRMIHYGTLGDQTIYTRFGLICLFILLIIFAFPCFNTGHR